MGVIDNIAPIKEELTLNLGLMAAYLRASMLGIN